MGKVDGEVQIVKSTITRFIGLIREIFDADVCYLYLISNDMDINEKNYYFEERIQEIKKAYLERLIDFPEELAQSSAYDVKILKFIDLVEKGGEKEWHYNYKNTPRKYVIFKNYQSDKEIFGEGITAYIARSKQILIFNDHNELIAHKSGAYLNTKHKIAPPSYMMVGFPLTDESGNVIGVLKVENYNMYKKCNYTEYSYEIIEVTKYLPLLVRLIKSSEAQFIKNSYKELFGGMNLLENLKRLKPSGVVNTNIYEATLHLFFVLKRKEYIGHKEILDRVNAYVNDISGYLGLTESEMYFNIFLNEFKKNEELVVYGLDDYIDHFMHKFHVFISGYIIINELGIDLFRLRVKESMCYALGSKSSNLEISESDLLRIWFLTAFYHDHTYVLEKIDKQLSTFFQELYGYPFCVKFCWDQFLSKESEFSRYLYYLVKFFNSPKGTNQDTLFENYLDSIIKSHDHGVLSALLLISYNRGVSYKRFNECLYAAFAISLHNRTVYENLTEENKRRITFESFPIAFLLAYCDTAQTFGRFSIKYSAKSLDYSILFSDIKVINGNITYELEYIGEKITKIPINHIIEKFAENIHNVFKSEEYSFEVTYCVASDFLPNEKEPIYTLSFH